MKIPGKFLSKIENLILSISTLLKEKPEGSLFFFIKICMFHRTIPFVTLQPLTFSS